MTVTQSNLDHTGGSRLNAGSMKTLFAALRETVGLSQLEAAELLEVRLDTVKSWSSGRRSASSSVIAELKALLVRQEVEAAAQAADWAARGTPADIAGLLLDDNGQARSRGWPTASVHNAVVLRAWARVSRPRPT